MPKKSARPKPTASDREREDDIFRRASAAYKRSLAGTAATPQQPSRESSSFTGINTYELRNVRGVLARFSVGKDDRIRRLEDAA